MIGLVLVGLDCSLVLLEFGLLVIVLCAVEVVTFEGL